jgi:hypothetical protein
MTNTNSKMKEKKKDKNRRQILSTEQMKKHKRTQAWKKYKKT